MKHIPKPGKRPRSKKAGMSKRAFEAMSKERSSGVTGHNTKSRKAAAKGVRKKPKR